MPSLNLASLAFTFLSLVAVGCAVAPDDATTGDDDEVSTEDAIKAASIAEGTFKLYAEPNVTPSPTCDVHTLLTLTNKGGAKAALRDALGSTPGMPQCKLFVQPNPREYRLRLDGTACGSKIYKGKKKIEGVWRSITITDHRTRTCRDLVRAKIIVEETGADGVQHTKYSYDGGPPQLVATWFTIAPKQCGTNPWNGFVPGKGQAPSHLQGEKGDVANFLASKNIGVAEIGFLYPSEPRFVCLACSCPRGDNLVVKAKSAADAQRLQNELGFAPLGLAHATAPKQCGTNPWEGGNPTGDERAETQQLASWAEKQGAPLSAAGFTDSTELRFVCQACNCPRGDTAVALTKDAASAQKLENLGWQRVEN